jgi:hypothetical protein
VMSVSVLTALAIRRGIPLQGFRAFHEFVRPFRVVFGSLLVLSGAVHHLVDARFAFFEPIPASGARRRWWRCAACHDASGMIPPWVATRVNDSIRSHRDDKSFVFNGAGVFEEIR